MSTNKLWDPFCWQSVLANCANNKELGSLDVMKINQWQLPLSHSVSDMREIANYIASIFKIKVGDLKMEIITLQNMMVQLKVRLAQPDYWSLVAESGNMFLTADGLSAMKKVKSNLRSKSRDKDQDERKTLMFWTCQKPFNRLFHYLKSSCIMFSVSHLSQIVLLFFHLWEVEWLMKGF